MMIATDTVCRNCGRPLFGHGDEPSGVNAFCADGGTFEPAEEAEAD